MNESPYGHHHHHGDQDGPSLTAGSARRLLIWVVGLLAVVTLAGLAVLWPRDDPVVDTDAFGFSELVQATVTSAETRSCSYDPATECRQVAADLTSGPQAGDVVSLETSIDARSPASKLEDGDRIVLNDAGPEIPDEERYSFADVERRTPLLLLVALFAAVVIALGRLRGLLALFGVALSVGVLLVFVFPALLSGTSPLPVALTATSVIAFGTLYLAHGVNERTTVALLGTLASLGLTALLAVAFTGAAELSGVASDESVQLLQFAPELDFRGLLLAAVVIGTLGVLDDVTITQVSAVWELFRADPGQGRRHLFGAAIRIGRDHIASTVNTLVLAYAAAALPLMLLFTQSGLGLGDVATTETVAVEIVQTLVGSIGLVASVPLTTALAAWVVTLPDAEGRRVGRAGGAGSRSGREPDPAAPAPWWDAPPQPGPRAPVPQEPPSDPWTAPQPRVPPRPPQPPPPRAPQPRGPQPRRRPPPDLTDDDLFWRRPGDR